MVVVEARRSDIVGSGRVRNLEREMGIVCSSAEELFLPVSFFRSSFEGLLLFSPSISSEDDPSDSLSAQGSSNSSSSCCFIHDLSISCHVFTNAILDSSFPFERHKAFSDGDREKYTERREKSGCGDEVDVEVEADDCSFNHRKARDLPSSERLNPSFRISRA